MSIWIKGKDIMFSLRQTCNRDLCNRVKNWLNVQLVGTKIGGSLVNILVADDLMPIDHQ